MSWPAPTGDPVGPDRGAPGPVPQPGAGWTPQAGVSAAPAYPAAPAAAWPAAPVGYPTDPTRPAEHTLTPVGAGPIQTLPPGALVGPRLAPLNQRTGQPARPWTIWASSVLLFCGAVAVVVGLLLAMWRMANPWIGIGSGLYAPNDQFNEATWLTAQFPAPPASGMRVLFAILCCVIAVLVAGVASVIAYYAFAGFGWTRTGGLVAFGFSLLALLLTPIASISIGFAALAAVPLWLPTSGRFFRRWQQLRHPQPSYSAPIDQVFYGPLPRYR